MTLPLVYFLCLLNNDNRTQRCEKCKRKALRSVMSEISFQVLSESGLKHTTREKVVWKY